MLKKLLTAPTEELGRMSYFLVSQVRIWFHCFRLLFANRCFTQAAALAYHTLFGLVPLVIVLLMVLNLFSGYKDMTDKVKGFVYETLNLTQIEYPVDEPPVADKVLMDDDDSQSPPSVSEKQTVTVADKLDEITSSYVQRVNTGAITAVGSGLVFFAVISLLTTIERAFNNIWHIRRGRSLLDRLFVYSGMLVVGVGLLAAMFSFTTNYLLLRGDQTNGLIGYVNFVRPAVPYLVSLLMLFFLYLKIPNSRVNPWAALWGAFVAAILWTAVKYAFGLYVLKVIPYQKVYGALGIIPLTVFWIFVAWVIVLFGLQLTYATQHLKTLQAAEFGKMEKAGGHFIANDISAIRVMEYVLRVFDQKDQTAVSAAVVATRLNMPEDLVEQMLDHMVTEKLLYRTTEPVEGYVPSTDGKHITLADVSEAIEQAAYAQLEEGRSQTMQEVVVAVRAVLAKHSLADVLEPWKKEDNVSDDSV